MSSTFAENDCLGPNRGDGDVAATSSHSPPAGVAATSHSPPAGEEPNSTYKGSFLRREDSYSDQDLEPDSPSWMTGLRHRARICKYYRGILN